ncbi:WRKY transcription factor [Dionaea muscipula]
MVKDHHSICMGDEFDDWDLQAIIEGRRSSDDDSVMMSLTDLMQSSCFSSLGMIEDYYYMDETAAAMSFLDELDQLHKPFLVCCDDHNVEEIKDDTSPMDQEDQVKVKKPRLSTSLDPLDNIQIDSSTGEAAATPMARRRLPRKSKSKIKVVHQVAAVGSVPDKWNWRKYGQKPIKGSPYPRSYYRCSSSVGCQAKKQVEQSSTEPDMYIITYISEHSHPHHGRRQAAGRARKNSPISNNEKKDPICTDDGTNYNNEGQDLDEIKEIIKEEEELDEVAFTPDLIWPEDSAAGSIFPMLELYQGISSFDHLPLSFT